MSVPLPVLVSLWSIAWAGVWGLRVLGFYFLLSVFVFFNAYELRLSVWYIVRGREGHFHFSQRRFRTS